MKQMIKLYSHNVVAFNAMVNLYEDTMIYQIASLYSKSFHTD